MLSWEMSFPGEDVLLFPKKTQHAEMLYLHANILALECIMYHKV